MKNILVILFVFFAAGISTFGQSLHIDSTRFITGINPSTIIRFAIPTHDKGFLFTGWATFNAGGIIPYFPYGNENVLVGKVDSNQQISWIKQYGGGESDVAMCACQTDDGGFAILATTGSNNGDVTGFKGLTDIWLIRLDASGNLLWQKNYGSSETDGALSIASTSDHGFIILGLTNGSDGDVPVHYGSIWETDWLVIRTDSAGSIQWSKVIGGTGADGGGSILSVDTSYYIVCNTNSTDHDCTDSFWHIGVNTGKDYHVLKLGNSGNVLWDSSYGGSGSEGISYAMFDVRDSSIVIIGTTNSVDYMVTGYHGCDNGDMWVVKVDRNGKLLWQKILGSIQIETGKSICAGRNGGYVAYGETFPYACNDADIGDIGNHDCWLFNLDNLGNVISDKIFGGTSGDLPFSVVPYLNGFVATGLSGSKFFTEGTTYGNFDTSSLNPDGGGAFASYIGYSTVGVNNIVTAGKLIVNVYPNPASQQITIKDAKNGSYLMMISDMTGRIMHQSKFFHKTEVDVKQWQKGIYFLALWDEEGGKYVQKLMVND